MAQTKKNHNVKLPLYQADALKMLCAFATDLDGDDFLTLLEHASRLADADYGDGDHCCSCGQAFTGANFGLGGDHA